MLDRGWPCSLVIDISCHVDSDWVVNTVNSTERSPKNPKSHAFLPSKKVMFAYVWLPTFQSTPGLFSCSLKIVGERYSWNLRGLPSWSFHSRWTWRTWRTSESYLSLLFFLKTGPDYWLLDCFLGGSFQLTRLSNFKLFLEVGKIPVSQAPAPKFDILRFIAA